MSVSTALDTALEEMRKTNPVAVAAAEKLVQCCLGHSWEAVTEEVTFADPSSYAGDGHRNVTFLECSVCGEVSEDL